MSTPRAAPGIPVFQRVRGRGQIHPGRQHGHFPGLPGVSVLFIDLDLRRPVQSEMLGLPVKQKNELGTLLSESAAPEKILSAAVTDPSTGLHSLLSTKSYTDVIELLASDQLAKVVALAREQYDYVIIDSPPLGFFSDSELLSDLSDASVLVVRQDTVPAPEINDAIDALRAGKAEFWAASSTIWPT